MQRGIPKVQFEDGEPGKLRTTGLNKTQRERNNRAFELAKKEGYIDAFGQRCVSFR